ncbi:hypothetical protein CSUI_004125 [Cystoisospora suis]|uniref:Uncharacterized protein n=1 Tax=Cystoisospora suis TaxID=483139 RepID=A0A2C6L2W7_9APIC|nr:hypothetical protein CSUI_004125 [Cystoisospora suis]
MRLLELLLNVPQMEPHTRYGMSSPMKRVRSPGLRSGCWTSLMMRQRSLHCRAYGSGMLEEQRETHAERRMRTGGLCGLQGNLG